MHVKTMLRDILAVISHLASVLATADNEILDEVRASHQAIETGLAEWRPQVQLTDKQVGQIIDKLSDPLSVPSGMAKVVADLARYGNVNQIEQIGYGQYPLTAEWTFRPNGELFLRLASMNGEQFWSGTFRGPQ